MTTLSSLSVNSPDIVLLSPLGLGDLRRYIQGPASGSKVHIHLSQPSQMVATVGSSELRTWYTGYLSV